MMNLFKPEDELTPILWEINCIKELIIEMNAKLECPSDDRQFKRFTNDIKFQEKRLFKLLKKLKTLEKEKPEYFV